MGLVVWCFGRIFLNTFRLSLIQAQPGCSQVQSFFFWVWKINQLHRGLVVLIGSYTTYYLPSLKPTANILVFQPSIFRFENVSLRDGGSHWEGCFTSISGAVTPFIAGDGVHLKCQKRSCCEDLGR